MAYNQNDGGQVITFSYKEEATSTNFNKLLHNVLPKGFLTFGGITKLSNTSIRIGKFTCLVSDSNTNVTLRIETTKDITLPINDSGKPFIIGEFNWNEVESNYLHIQCVCQTEYELKKDTCLVFGKLVFNGTTLSDDVDYTFRTDTSMMRNDYLSNEPSFHVTPSYKVNVCVNINGGTAYIGGKKIVFNGKSEYNVLTDLGSPSAFSRDTDLLLYIDNKGDVHCEESSNGSTPVIKSNTLGLAIIHFPSGSTEIKLDNLVENIYAPNFVQSNSNSFIFNNLTTDNVVTSNDFISEDTKYTIASDNVTLTLPQAISNGTQVKVLFGNKGNVKYKANNVATNVTDSNILSDRILTYTWFNNHWFCSSAPEKGSKFELLPTMDFDSPMNIYGGQWELQDFNGLYFRNDNGNAKPFMKKITNITTNEYKTVILFTNFNTTYPTYCSSNYINIGDIVLVNYIDGDGNAKTKLKEVAKLTYINESLESVSINTKLTTLTNFNNVVSIELDSTFIDEGESYTNLTSVIFGQHEGVPEIYGELRPSSSNTVNYGSGNYGNYFSDTNKYKAVYQGAFYHNKIGHVKEGMATSGDFSAFAQFFASKGEYHDGDYINNVYGKSNNVTTTNISIRNFIRIY